MQRYNVIITPEANNQLNQLFHYIASTSSAITAKRYIDAVVKFCCSLEIFPHRGQIRDDLQPGFRITNYRKRTAILFKVDETTVKIIGIYYGGQNYEAHYIQDDE